MIHLNNKMLHMTTLLTIIKQQKWWHHLGPVCSCGSMAIKIAIGKLHRVQTSVWLQKGMGLVCLLLSAKSPSQFHNPCSPFWRNIDPNLLWLIPYINSFRKYVQDSCDKLYNCVTWNQTKYTICGRWTEWNSGTDASNYNLGAIMYFRLSRQWALNKHCKNETLNKDWCKSRICTNKAAIALSHWRSGYGWLS